MRLSYYRGIGISVLTFMGSLLFFARLDLILITIGFSPESSLIAWHGILALLPYIMLNIYIENLRMYMLTLGYEKIFYYTNFVELFGGLIFGYVFIWHWQWGIYGVALSKFALNFVCLGIYWCGWAKFGFKESFRQGEGFREIFFSRYFRDFCCFWVKNTTPAYMEYIGYEIMTILSGIYGDTD